MQRSRWTSSIGLVCSADNFKVSLCTENVHTISLHLDQIVRKNLTHSIQLQFNVRPSNAKSACKWTLTKKKKKLNGKIAREIFHICDAMNGWKWAVKTEKRIIIENASGKQYKSDCVANRSEQLFGTYYGAVGAVVAGRLLFKLQSNVPLNTNFVIMVLMAWPRKSLSEFL